MSDKEELESLKKTFEEFIALSGQLERSYELLKEESRKLSLYLSNILENLNSAIMVFDNEFQLNLWNGMCRVYFPFLTNRQPPVSLQELSSSPDAALDLRSVLTTNQRLVELETMVDRQARWLEVDSSDFIDYTNRKIGYLLVIHDKTELKRLQIRSRQEERLRVMGELAAEVAHEIRNPLGSIELMVTMLQEDNRNDERGSELLSRIRTSVDNMNHIVTNILIYTRELKPATAPFPVEALLDAAESIAMNVIVKKQLTVKKNAVGVEATGDFELLKQSVANIVINAAQASPPGGVIGIEADVNDAVLVIRVKDNGPGIPDDIRDKIFNPFFTTKNTGTGLGLAMVRRVIEAHGGRIFFESTGNGTLFIIEIPIK